ncbi:MAG: metallophosphoesterase family protein [Candidatus Kryptoniota bacterium]
MKYAIISDIHSNIEALTTVLREISKKRVDEIICLGDVVGYGANPDEVVEIVRREAKYAVRGNHDDALFSEDTFSTINSYAQAAITYTRELLSDANLEWLRNIPLTHKIENVLMVHASPAEPGAWKYIFTNAEAQVELSTLDEKICLIGHTHVPVIFKTSAPMVDQPTAEDSQIKELINVGSVGQPRDGDNRASFGVIDTSNFTYENFRIEYSFGTAAAKILAAGLPPFLAERLYKGK